MSAFRLANSGCGLARAALRRRPNSRLLRRIAAKWGAPISCRNRHCPKCQAAETLLTIGADPKHLGARLGVTLVLHTWGSSLTHHPHVHGIVPGGGLSADGDRWIACKPGFFLSVRVLSRLFRRRFLEELQRTHQPAS